MYDERPGKLSLRGPLGNTLPCKKSKCSKSVQYLLEIYRYEQRTTWYNTNSRYLNQRIKTILRLMRVL